MIFGLELDSLSFGFNLDLAKTFLRLTLDSVLASPGLGLDNSSFDYSPT